MLTSQPWLPRVMFLLLYFLSSTSSSLSQPVPIHLMALVLMTHWSSKSASMCSMAWQRWFLGSLRCSHAVISCLVFLMPMLQLVSALPFSPLYLVSFQWILAFWLTSAAGLFLITSTVLEEALICISVISLLGSTSTSLSIISVQVGSAWSYTLSGSYVCLSSIYND